MDKTIKILEAVLFLKGRTGTDISELMQTLKLTKKEIAKSLDELKELYEESDSIYQIKIVEKNIRLTLKTEVAKELSTKLDRTINVRLSKSVVETLTIIAYNQPATKPEVERLRGVSSDYAFRKLQDYDLIQDLGKSNLPGQPTIYGTTNTFLDLFGMNDISELPIMEGTFEEQTTEMVALFDRE